jgi:glycosyltransferase involved in cell wall biosynthesis
VANEGDPVSRVLWLGNPPWAPSGYSEQAGLFLPRLQALGHELAVVCNWGLQGTKLEWQGLTCYPSDGAWGNETVAAYAKHHQADLVIALCDAWVLKPDAWPEGTTVAVWTPIDHYPIPPAVLAVLAQDRIKPIAMSRFGETLMNQAHLDPCYVPHGVNTQLFRPQPEIRDQVRDELDIPRDAFLVGMVAANKGNPSVPRKAFPQAFHAFSMFARKHRDAYLYVHTEAQPPIGGGINLDHLANAVGAPEGRLRFPPDEAWQLGMSREVVAAIYQAFDVLLNPSMGEGFGIPILEAQASGCPVITSDHSSMPELTHAGWLVKGDPWWDALQDSFLIMPSIDSIVAALEDAYERRGDQDLRAAAVEFAQGYDADLVTETYWVPTLEKLQRPREVAPLAARNGLNRQQRRDLERRARKLRGEQHAALDEPRSGVVGAEH